MTYDVVLIFGSGIKEDGSLPASSISCVEKVISLYKDNHSLKLITCGKWAYDLPFTPPLTEAAALRMKAIELGFPRENIFTEDMSITTISNACLAKEEFLERFGWNHVLLVSVYPQSKRAQFNLERVLGPEYTCKLVLADFNYPKEKEQALEAIEQQKLIDAQNFLNPLPLGDHKAIFNAAMADLQQHYIQT